jgi:hypothetical protein
MNPANPVTVNNRVCRLLNNGQYRLIVCQIILIPLSII